MNTPSRLGLVLLLALALCDAGWRALSPAGGVAISAAVPDTGAQSPASCTHYRVVREGLIPMPEGVPAAHASSLVALPQTHPLHAQKAVAAFWFAGTRESGADVQIAASTFDRATQAWDVP